MPQEVMYSIGVIEGAQSVARAATLSMEKSIGAASNKDASPVDRAFALGRIHMAAETLKDAAFFITDSALGARGIG